MELSNFLRRQAAKAIRRPPRGKGQRVVSPYDPLQEGIPIIVHPLVAMHLRIDGPLLDEAELARPRFRGNADLINLLLRLRIAKIRSEECLQQMPQHFIERCHAATHSEMVPG